MPKVAFRQIRSRQIYLNYPAFRREIDQTIERKSKPELLAAHERVTVNWKTKITFKARKVINRSGITVYVFATGENKEIWGYVTGGTKGGYKIPKQPKPPGSPLRFRTGYKPRTAPVGKFGGPGVSRGPWRSKHQVTHPGIKPRRFEHVIATDYKPTFSRDMENASRRGVRRMRGK